MNHQAITELNEKNASLAEFFTEEVERMNEMRGQIAALAEFYTEEAKRLDGKPDAQSVARIVAFDLRSLLDGE